MSEDEHCHLVIRLENVPRRPQVRFLGIEIGRYSMASEQVKAIEGSLEVVLNERRGYAEQHQEYGVDRDHHLKDIIDDSKPAHERILKQDVVIKDAYYPKQLPGDRHDRRSCKKEKRQQHPT